MSALENAGASAFATSRPSGRGVVARALGRRLLQALVTLLGTTMLVWALLPLSPGNPARRYLEARNVTAPTVAQVAHASRQLGLDKPLTVQYIDWLGGVVHGNLSNSYISGAPVTTELADRFPATLRLALVTLLLALAVAVPAGVIGALTAGRWPDVLTRIGAAFGAATPSFVTGLALLYIVVLRFGIGDVVSTGSFSQALLPAIALAPLPAARWSRLLRAGLIDALGSDYALVARARGASRLRVVFVHALPNAGVPLLTAIALTAGYLLAGDVVVETVFSWPGVGAYLAQSVANRDLPVIQGYALIVASIWIVISLGLDLVSGIIDPRTRLAAGRGR
jgi:ABC-type dipeptide/oligopeptide/nickel transport system permease component